MKPRLFAIFVIFLALLAACGSPARTTLSQNRARWDAQGARHYRFTLQVGCFCPYRDPVSIEVLDGQVVAVAPLGINPDLNVPEYYAQYETIEGLFDYAANALAEADEVTIAYNAEFGFPEQISIDWIKMAVDDEMSITITGFQVLE